jgi:hypothetical protein
MKSLLIMSMPHDTVCECEKEAIACTSTSCPQKSGTKMTPILPSSEAPKGFAYRSSFISNVEPLAPNIWSMPVRLRVLAAD